MKRKTLTFSRFISGLLVLLMSFSLIVPTFANATIDTLITIPTNPNPNANITVGKTLTSQTVGLFPDETKFEFLLEPVSYTPGPDAASLDAGIGYTNYTTANLPMPGNSGDGTTVLNADNTATIKVTVADEDPVSTKRTGETTTPDITYTQSGIYAYELTEVKPTGADPDITYDTSKNYINVYVTNVLTETEDGKLIPVLDDRTGLPMVTVSAITGWIGDNDPYLDMLDPTKATPDPDTDNGKTTIERPKPEGGPVNIQYPFENTYSLIDFFARKFVTGDLADPMKAFEFTLNLRKIDPETETTYITDDRPFQYMIYDAVGNTYDRNGEAVAPGTRQTISNNDTFLLKHNQYIQIQLPTREQVQITEGDYSTLGYITTYRAIDSEEDRASAPQTGRVASVTTLGDFYGCELQFFNHKQSTPPTGIMLDVVPFVMIVVVAGLGIMTITKKRKVEER